MENIKANNEIFTPPSPHRWNRQSLNRAVPENRDEAADRGDTDVNG